MKHLSSVDKAKKFLSTLKHIDLDNTYDYCDDYDFSNYRKSYFVYMDVEFSGCFEKNTRFCSKREVNKIINEQMNGENKWDHVVILDIKNNKTLRISI